MVLLACQLEAEEPLLLAAASERSLEAGDKHPVPAPPIDLDKPLPEAPPLSLPVEDDESEVADAEAPAPSKGVTQAKSVDLGEPMPAATW